MSRAIVEVQMIPSHSQPPSKRKGADDMNPLGNASKKQKKEKSTNKRKLNGEEQPGGLIIVRAPSTPAGPSQRPPSRQPSTQSQPAPDEPPKPPTKKFRADGTTTAARQLAKNKDRQIQPSTRADPEVDEDVRQMQTEADTLRRKSQAAEQSMGTLSIPKTPNRQQAPYSERRIREETQPVPEQETPQIERNRFMREGGSNHRRKSSLTRGKRISSSYEATGVISQPHTSVSDSSFYKHIDGDLPESARARQLLIWCSHRAMNQPDQLEASSSKRREPKKSGKDPPPVSAEGVQLLKRVQENVIKMLAEKQVDTNVYGAADAGDRPKKENEQNVKNRAREIRFNAHNQRMKAEEDAWIEVTNHYNAIRSEVAAEMDKAASAKAKGKQRAIPEDDWDIDERDLPEHFRGKSGIGLARRLMNVESARQDPLGDRLDSLEEVIDRLHSLSNSALETTRIAETDLNRRFAMLNISLATRSQPAPTSLPSTSGALSSYLPPSLSRPPPTTDPQDLLRALSRIDAERPQTQVGDAARRAAREVQRAADAPGGMTERRLTAGVAPPTPRKPPGTPRRAATPGKGR